MQRYELAFKYPELSVCHPLQVFLQRLGLNVATITKKMAIVSALLILVLVDLLKAHGTSVTPVSEATSMEQSRDPSMQPSTELPPDYSGDSLKENDTEQVGNTGMQGSGQITWELSGEPSTEFTPKPSVEPSQEPTQESSTEISE